MDTKLASQPLGERADMLMMSGDQIYADHVSGPLLDAILQTIKLLGLPDETFPDGPLSSAKDLYLHPDSFYGRDSILPHHFGEETWIRKFLPKRHIPIFSARESENHLITFAEYFAMYLLVWSLLCGHASIEIVSATKRLPPMARRFLNIISKNGKANTKDWGLLSKDWLKSNGFLLIFPPI